MCYFDSLTMLLQISFHVRLLLLVHIIKIPATEGYILRLNECWKYGAKFTKVHRDKVLVGSVLTSFAANGTDKCIGGCIMAKRCKSVNMRRSDQFCQLNSEETIGNEQKLEGKKGWEVLETSNEEKSVSKHYV